MKRNTRCRKKHFCCISRLLISGINHYGCVTNQTFRAYKSKASRALLFSLFFLLVFCKTGLAHEEMFGEEHTNEQTRTEQMLASILRSAPSGIGVVENRIIVSVNEYILELTGYSSEELQGQDSRIFYPTDKDYEYVGQEKYRQITEKGTGSVETQWLHKDGSIIYVLLSSTPLDRNNLDLGIVFTVLDITENKLAVQELKTRTRWFNVFMGIFLLLQLGLIAILFYNLQQRKKAEEEIRTLNDELEQRVKKRTAQLEIANRELNAFTYSASHDLRGPLNRISGFSEALLEDYLGQLDPQARDYLQRINNSCENMKILIDDLLKLSRVTQTQLNSEQVNLSSLTCSCLKALQAKDPHRSVEIVIAPDIIVKGDSSLLSIALENMLENAWKYTASQEKALIEFGSTDNKKGKYYFIRDNGTGFDMAYAEKIFAPFQRLHSENDYPGTGIGLSIVTRIITRHGGNVWAEGEVGKGAAFFFTLP